MSYNKINLTEPAQDPAQADLAPVDLAIMSFARQIALDASRITQGDVQRLRDHGLTDAEIVDVAAAASARCFFSKLLDALGAEPDSIFSELDDEVREHLTVGRAISRDEVERLP